MGFVSRVEHNSNYNILGLLQGGSSSQGTGFIVEHQGSSRQTTFYTYSLSDERMPMATVEESHFGAVHQHKAR